MKMPLISVLMAVYQVASIEQLDMSIASVLAQSFFDFELIICVDGAADDVCSAIAIWGNTDPRITVTYNKRNLGAGVARNRAAQLATGQYIAIMDADDSSSPSRLEQQLSFLEEHPQFSFVGTGGSFFSRVPEDSTTMYWFVSQPSPQDFLMTLPFVHASLLFRREAFFSVGGYRELARVKRSEDYDLLLRLYARGMRGANLPEPLYHIRADAAMLSRRKYRYRYLECVVKMEGFYHLHLMPKGIAFALKPLLVGLLPSKLLERWKRHYYRSQNC